MSSSQPPDPNAAARRREAEHGPGTGPSLAIQQHLAGGRQTILIAGELDKATAPQLDALISRLATRPGEIVLDVKGLTFMDSTGVRLILRALELCSEHGCSFTLRSPTPEVRRLLDAAGVSDYLDEQGALGDGT